MASLVSGDAKPWTLAQVASGAHVANAVAEGRAHNVGVITNAAVVPAYAGLHHVYYGKREAEPYTPAQVLICYNSLLDTCSSGRSWSNQWWSPHLC